MADCMHEVRLAETHAAIQEKRVVAVARRLGNGLRRGVSKLRVVTDNERGELESGVELGWWDNGCVRLQLDSVVVPVVTSVVATGSEVTVVGDQGRPAAGRRDHEIDIHLGTRDRLECF